MWFTWAARLALIAGIVLLGSDGFSQPVTGGGGSAGAPKKIASGATALGTSAISSATCASAVTAAASGVLTTDAIIASFNGDPTGTTGFLPAVTGMLVIFVYPTANNVNFKVCNTTSSSVTPGALTINWEVVR